MSGVVDAKAILDALADDECPTALLVSYLREHNDNWHQTAASRLEAYEQLIVCALRAQQFTTATQPGSLG